MWKEPTSEVVLEGVSVNQRCPLPSPALHISFPVQISCETAFLWVLAASQPWEQVWQNLDAIRVVSGSAGMDVCTLKGADGGAAAFRASLYGFPSLPKDASQ